MGNSEFGGLQNEATFETSSMKKKRRKAIWGKFKKNACGARQCKRSTDECLLRFNTLYEEVKADRLKKGETIKE